VQRVALVTGGNRGIGLAACRRLAESGFRVLLTGRDREAVPHTAERLRAEGLDVTPEALDVSDPDSVDRCADRLRRQDVGVDVLVNNAAVLVDEWGGVLELTDDVLVATLQTNLLGALRTCRAFVPGMVERRYGRVVNVSSGAGSLSRMGGYAPAYSMSKAALNALTRQVAAHVRGDVKVNALDPGWVRTDMGGRGGSRSVDQAADDVLWLATLPSDGPTGGFFYLRQPADW
jgi:NAD(P)-dependent dehydrogenase (short-subunit alcohol dehydrogenase family)